MVTSATGKYSRDVISPSLLEKIRLSINKPLNADFDLGMSDWMDLPPNTVLDDKKISSDGTPPSKR